MHLIYFRIQNEAAAIDGCDEHKQEPAQCSQKFPEETNSLAVNSQLDATKSYKCQLCNEIFLSVHELFSHELKNHENVGTSQIDRIKKPSLQMYSQCKEVFSSKNDAHQTEILDRNPRTDALNMRNSQKQEWNPQTEAFNMRGKPQKQDGNQQRSISNMGWKQDGNQQTGISNMGQEQDGNQQTGISNMGHEQDGNQQTGISNMGQEQDGNQQTAFLNMGQKQDENQQTAILNMGQKQDGDQETGISNKGWKQDGNQQTGISNMGQKQDGDQTEASGTGGKLEEQYRCRLGTEIFSSLNNSLQHENKTHDWEVDANTENMNSEQEKDTAEECINVYMCHLCKKTFNSETDVLIHEIRKHDSVTSDENAYLVSEESFTSESELQDHNNEPEFLQQDDDHFESNVTGKGEETASETVKLPELMTTESEGIPLPYKCPTCDESFETKCRLFYHDLEVHVGITKPGTAQSIKGTQKNEKGKKTFNEGGMKRIAKYTPDEQQPMKVIITEKQSNGGKVKEKQKLDRSIAKQVTIKKIWKADAGDRIIKKLIMKERIIQGKGMKRKVVSEKRDEHIKKTIEALTGKNLWKETSDEIGGENKVDEYGGQTQTKTFVIVKNGQQSGEGNRKISGGCRIDVITNYVLSQSQVKQFLMNDGDWGRFKAD
jgi:hypothetical protein